ncbi:hypothetical protein AB1Y20_010171 [Prymnesium parvum]|uniref:Uncharacterized protein n=1 Tax=Prymnesium parvum TaxID=97485 RepID=A0AB34K6D8_PRYPA
MHLRCLLALLLLAPSASALRTPLTTPRAPHHAPADPPRASPPPVLHARHGGGERSSSPPRVRMRVGGHAADGELEHELLRASAFGPRFDDWEEFQQLSPHGVSAFEDYVGCFESDTYFR